jgi:hypothetical protein
MATTDEHDIDQVPATYRTTHAARLVSKVNKNPARSLADSRYRATAQWADATEDQALALTSRLSGAYLNVREFGAVGDGTTDDTEAIQETIDACADRGVTLVVIPPGTYRTTAPLEYPGELTISGAGAQSTIIAYEGAGYAFAPAAIGARVFNARFRELTITLEAAADGGIDLTDMSLAKLEGVVVFGSSNIAGGGYGFHVAGTTNGYAVYNRFTHCRALTCEHGFDIAGSGSNDTHLDDCRTANCLRGISIVDANHTVIDTCCIESGATGVYVEATTANVCDATTMIANRFEGNTVSNITYGGTAANIRDPREVANNHVTAVATVTGTPTRRQLSAGPEGLAVVSPTADTPFRLERTSAGGSFLPCLFVADTNEGSGSPTTIRAGAGRSAGRVFEGGTYLSSVFTATFHVTATGDLTAATLAAASASITSATGLTFTHQNSILTIGLTATSGTAGIRFNKGAANNQSTLVWYSNDVAQFNLQHDSAENLSILDTPNASAVIWQIQQTGKSVRHANGTRYGGASGPLVTSGAGAPSASDPDGSLFLRTDGTAGTTLYVRAAGAWSALT